MSACFFPLSHRFSSVQVAEQSQEMKGEYFTTFMNDVNSYVKDLTKSSSPQDVLGGILALSAFLNSRSATCPLVFVEHSINTSSSAFHIFALALVSILGICPPNINNQLILLLTVSVAVFLLPSP